MDKNTRLNLEHVQIGFRLSGLNMTIEEVECIIANLIFKGFIKGYISHEKSILVLSNSDAFPMIRVVGTH